jgi:hypothetical protein
MTASFQLYAAIAPMIAKLSIQLNAASAMAAAKSTKKHLTDLMIPKDFKYTPQPSLSP